MYFKGYSNCRVEFDEVLQTRVGNGQTLAEKCHKLYVTNLQAESLSSRVYSLAIYKLQKNDNMFKKPRRVARKVGLNDDGEGEISTAVVQRPNLKATKPVARTSLAIGIAGDTETTTDGDASISLAHKKVEIARKASERQAELNSRLALRIGDLRDRPSYSSNDLAELKSSNLNKSRLSNTKPISEYEPESEVDIDIASKFGPEALNSLDAEPSLIPTEAEIREKKERRRRLAKEQEFISLNDAESDDTASDSEDGDQRKKSLILPAEELKPREKYAETRLVHEDEDIAEGFEEFTEDPGQVTLSKRAAREQGKKRRIEIQEMIENAQHGSSDSESADSDEEARNRAYEAVQTRAGTYGSNRKGEPRDSDGLMKRLESAPKIAPLPDLSQALKKANEYKISLEDAQAQRHRRLADLRAQREELIKEQQRLPILMKEAGERYEKWKAEVGITEMAPQEDINGAEPRGLETFGAMAALPEA